MSLEKAIYDFLVQDGNLSTAMEMASLLEQFKNDMHKRFWQYFNIYMDQKIRNSEISSKWKYSPYNTRRIRQDWEKTKITPELFKGKNQQQLQFVFAQGGSKGGFPLYWGVCWSEPPIGFNSPLLTTLGATLVYRNITIPEPPKWIFWGWYKKKIYDPDVLTSIYLNTDDLIAEITTDVWSLFMELQPLLEKINIEVENTK